jgi:hypothetical protein
MIAPLHTVRPEGGFRALQHAFTAHLREPDRVPRPAGVEERRMGIYRELLFNNVKGFLDSAFPVTRWLLGDERWLAMVKDFFARHRCATPLFMEIPQEFLSYLENERDGRSDPPFLYDLAHYEWVELALDVATDSLHGQDVDPNGDLLEGTPALSPLAWPLAYDWPVHRIGPDFLPDQPQATYLVVYRDRGDRVGFLEANPVTMRLLQLLEEGAEATGRELLMAIAAELRHPAPQVVIQGGHAILEDLRHRDVILGTRRGHP